MSGNIVAMVALVVVIAFLLAYIVFLHFSRERELNTIIAGMLSQNPYEFSSAVGSRPHPMTKAAKQAAIDAGKIEPPQSSIQRAL